MASHRLGKGISPDLDAVVLRQPDGTYAFAKGDTLDPLCEHTHGDFEALADWLQCIRVSGEVLCPTCAHANFETSRTPSKCVMCGRSALLTEEASAFHHRTRVFCEDECQRAFYADPVLPLAGVAPLGGFIIAGVLERKTLEQAREDPKKMSDKEIENRAVFFRDNGAVPRLIRDHQDSAVGFTGAVLPQYPTIFEVLESMIVIDEMCRTEMKIHYTYRRPIVLEKNVFEISSTDAFKGYAPILEARLAVKVAAMVFDNKEDRDQLKLLVNSSRLMTRHERTEGVLSTHLDDAAIAHIIARRDEYKKRLSYGSQALRVALEYAKNYRKFSNKDAASLLRRFAPLWDVILGKGNHYNFSTRRWNESVWQSAEEAILGEAGFTEIDVELLGHPLFFFPNYQGVNDVVAGMRVSALVHAGISPAFTTVVDYFACNADVNADPVDGVNMFVVQEAMDTQLSDYLRELTKKPFSTQVLLSIKSVLAQVLLALEAAQVHLQFVHNDLHTGNVMLGRAPNSGIPVDFLQFRRPGVLGSMFLPARSLPGSRVVRLIDFGRSRVNKPGYPNDRNPSYVVFNVDDRATQIFEKLQAEWRFDEHTDMRVFAWALASQLKSAWGGLLSRPDAPPDADELSRVLEMMTGMDQWYDATPMAFRAETWDDPDAPVFLETVVARILAAPSGRRLRTAVRVVVEHGRTQTKFSDWLNMFRVLESYGVRPQDHQQTDGSASLADVLNDPFFDEFRPGVLGMGEFEIDFVGDATRRPGDGPGIRLPPGSVPVGPERGRKRQATEEDRSSTKQGKQERR